MACPYGFTAAAPGEQSDEPATPKLVRKRTHARLAIGLLNQQTSDGQDRFAYSRYFPEFLKEHGCTWPPQASFNSWPPSWTPLMDLADEMPSKLATSSCAAEFRSWLWEECAMRVEQEGVLNSISDLLACSHEQECSTQVWNNGLDKLFGLLACSTYLVTGYRWGQTPVPLDAPQRSEREVDFPKVLWQVWEELNRIFGTPTAPCAVSTFLANAVYEGDCASNRECTSLRFRWNSDSAKSYKVLVKPPAGLLAEEDHWVHMRSGQVYAVPAHGVARLVGQHSATLPGKKEIANWPTQCTIVDNPFQQPTLAEYNLGLIFVNVETSCLPLLKALALFLAVDAPSHSTPQASQLGEQQSSVEEELLSKPLKEHMLAMLRAVRKCMRAVFAGFRDGLVPEGIDAEAFVNNVEILHGWSLTKALAGGELVKDWGEQPFGGSTAPQLLVMQVVDTFLNLEGDSPVQRGNVQSRECFTHSMRTLLEMLYESCSMGLQFGRSDICM
eukprot:TRINITY_DN11732_c0_g1_i1.p1 TRINITY_DN11732_c0_g1~~TRINITY_DN11732_c0_g1_i1.p1  ORF type:complete len:499 (-),score=106.47 TRINITY_DN11732_c0_g1_i1:637-2133(-)